MDTLSRMALIVGLCAVLGIAELLAPAERGQPLVERARNAAIIVVFLLLGGLFSRKAFMALSVTMQPPTMNPIILSLGIIAIALFVGDLIFYWYHRAQHALPWLWHVHALHHSDKHMNATTSLRTFWLESPIQSVLITIPVLAIDGADARAVVAAPVLLTIWLFFTHANVRLQLGRWTPLVVGPQLHRLHHSILPEHRDKNFAQFFPIIDVAFGTYLAPKHDEFPPTGTPGKETKVPLTTALTEPILAWLRL